MSDGSGSTIVDPQGVEPSRPAPRPESHAGHARATGWGAAYLSRTGSRHAANTGVSNGFSGSSVTPIPPGVSGTPVRTGRGHHVVIRVLLGTAIAAVVAANLWFLVNHELGRHGWLMRAGFGGTMGVIVGYFVSDAGRWRGFWAAVLATGTTVVMIQLVTPLAFRDTDIHFDSWGRNLVVGSIFGTLGAVQVARRRGRPPTAGGTYAVIGLLAVAALVLSGVVHLRGGMPGLDGSPSRGGLSPELRERMECIEIRMRARSAVDRANEMSRVVAARTPDGIDAEAFDNPWFTWRQRATNPPDDTLRYEIVSIDAPC